MEKCGRTYGQIYKNQTFPRKLQTHVEHILKTYWKLLNIMENIIEHILKTCLKYIENILKHIEHYWFPAPGCGIAIGSWMHTYRDLLGVRSLWHLLAVGSDHHNIVCHRMAFADLGLRSWALVVPGAAPRLGTGVWTPVPNHIDKKY